MKAWVVQPTAAYTVYQQPDYNIELIGGARYLRFENDVDIDIAGRPTGSGEEDGSV